jgi:hypothetical protein
MFHWSEGLVKTFWLSICVMIYIANHFDVRIEIQTYIDRRDLSFIACSSSRLCHRRDVLECAVINRAAASEMFVAFENVS